MTCGMVSPLWVALGWVHWAGTPNRERQMNIEYRRCHNPSVGPLPRGGFTFELCAEHAGSEPSSTPQEPK